MKRNDEKRERRRRDNLQLGIGRLLLRAKPTGGIKSPHLWIILILLAVFSYIYYFVLVSFQEVYLLIFLYPLLYAAIVYRLRGVATSSIILLAATLPQAFISASDPYTLARVILFQLFAITFSGVIAALLNYLESQFADYQEILLLNEELNKYIQQLEATQKQLVHAERLNAVGELAASVAHEINNPLAGVLVYAKLLAKKVKNGTLENEKMVEDLGKIEAAVSHCSAIVRGLLDFARQSEPQFGPVLLPQVIDQVLALVGHQAAMNRVLVVRENDGELPPVNADARQLQQVLVNLMVNAIQAMAEGGQLTIRTFTDDNGRAGVSLRDTGSGISPANMDRLFTPFFTTKGERGLGLGLAVSYGIVERHGGKITAESEVGKGSLFTVLLPVGQVAPPAPPP